MLEPNEQREILAVTLIALAFFVLLSLLPTSIFGSSATRWFPSGNPMGVIGRTLRAGLVAGVGGGSIVLPVLLAAVGLHLGRWIGSSWPIRVAAFAVGLVIVLPAGLHVLAPNTVYGGWWGENVGLRLVGFVGTLGATLALALALVTLSVATLRWNPLRTAGAGVARGGGWIGGKARTLATRWKEWRARPAPSSRSAPESGGSPLLPELIDDEISAPPSRAAHRSAAGSPSDRELPQPTGTESDLDPRATGGVADDRLPPLELLTVEERPDRQDMELELDRLGRVLVEKLRTFNVESELGGRTTGPMVTQFEVIPAPGVKVNRIANLDADLALAMKAQTVRIVAPIPGKGAVGVEIPNPEPEMVYLREILEAREFQSADERLPLALGKDLNGRPYVANLAKMPHALIAGATGSGKSVCVNTIITSLVCRHTPRTLRLLMIDPKMVELSAYADLPHLRHPVVTDPRDAAGVLKWAVLEMERRYQLLSANGVRSMAEFNRRVHQGVPLRRAHIDEDDEADSARWVYEDGVLPYIVVVVDELADLMMTVQSEVERPLTQLAQKARAIGIHLIVATQRPSVNVITGLIKANFPTRIAFRVASKTDSRTILDQNGAEALLGNGDMLFLPPGAAEPVRIQGAFVSTGDTDELLSWYRGLESGEEDEDVDEAVASVEPDILDQLRTHELMEASSVVEEIAGDWDELFRAAAEVCIHQSQGSTSLLQRRLKIGYGRAARIVDQLHDAGILGAPDGSKPREVLVSLPELDGICGPGSG